MGNCFSRDRRSSEEDEYLPWTVFRYPFHPAALYSMYYPRPGIAYCSPTGSYPNNTYHNPPSHAYTHSYNQNHRYGTRSRSPERRRRQTETYNLHPYPTGGRPLGPLHLAAAKENISLGHVPGGCYHQGRCERLHMRWTVRELERRGVDGRGVSLRQALRVVRGYEAGRRGDAYVGRGLLEQGDEGRRGIGWGGDVAGARGSGEQRMREMGMEGRSGRGRRGRGHDDAGQRDMREGLAKEAYMSGANPAMQQHASHNATGGAFANEMDHHPHNRAMSQHRHRGSRAPHRGFGSQHGMSRASGTDYESASRGGGRSSGWENGNSQYTGHGGSHGNAWKNNDGEDGDGAEYDDGEEYE